ncbi:MAG: hypothetical protein U0325_00555 [Polyangiales bacterium]
MIARPVIVAAVALAACGEPTRAVLRDAGPRSDAGAEPDVVDGGADPRAGAVQAGDCAVDHGGCSAYATCAAAGPGMRRCVCAPGLRVREDQRGCVGLLLASRDREGRASRGASGEPHLAPDGRFVAFVSAAARLASEAPPPTLDAPATPQCYVRDLRTGRTVVVSTNSEGGYAEGGACTSPQLVGDGTAVAFLYPDAPLSLRAPRGNGLQVYTRSLGDGLRPGAPTWVPVDRNRPGVNSGMLGGLRISRDGARMVFATDGRLSTNDDDTQTDLYLVQVATGAVTRVTQRADGRVAPWAPCAGGNVGGWWTLSRDGSMVTFNSARTFVTADADMVRDPYLARVDLPQVVLLAERRFALNDADCHVLELGTALSGDGRWVLFQSDNPRFDDALSYREPDYYLRDLAQGDRGDAGLRALRLRPGLADQPALSGDGRVAAVTSLTRIEDGGSGQRGMTPHLFRVELAATPTLEVVDRDGSGRVLDVERGRFAPSMSDDARAIAFTTTAPLLPEDQNGDPDVYVRVWW